MVGGDVTGGLGLRLAQFTVDLGAAAHEELGTSYLISIGYTRQIKGADGEGSH